MFGEEQLKLMKPNAIVLNTARGKVLDEKALARAIDEGRLRGAAIDAFEEEPLPMDSPLRKLGDRVLLSPHSASYTEGGELRQGVAWATRSVVDRTQRWHPRQCLQPRRHPALEGAFRRRQRDRLLAAPASRLSAPEPGILAAGREAQRIV